MALLGNDEKRSEFGKRSRMLANERFNWNVVGRQYIDLFKKFIPKSQPKTESPVQT